MLFFQRQELGRDQHNSGATVLSYHMKYRRKSKILICGKDSLSMRKP